MLKLQSHILYFIATLFLVCLLFTSCEKENILSKAEIEWLKNNEDIKVITYNDYPPYQFLSSTGEMRGVFIDYLSLIEKKINYKFRKIEYKDWSKALLDAKTNEVGMILQIQETKPRLEYLNFFDEIFDSQIVIVTRENDIKKTSFSHIKHSNIVVPKDYYIADLLQHAHPGINLSYEKDEKACLEALSKGKYDAYLGSDSNTTYFIETFNLKGLIVSGKAPFKYRPTLGVVKKNKMLNQIMEKAVKSISMSEREELLSKWVQKEYYPIFYRLNFWFYVIGCAIIILLASLYFNWFLNKKVNERTIELNEALIKATKTSCIKTNFIQNISHEIRTPMNRILGYSELLKKEEVSPSEQYEYIDSIINDGKNLVHIVDNVLEISDLQSEEHSVNADFVDISKVFDHVIAFYKPNSEKKGIQLILQPVDNNDKFIYTDRLRLIKILKNVIGNAIKFTSEGKVVVSFKKRNSDLEIQVSDTGIGIKKSKQDIIFDEFLKLEESNVQKLSGIGLGLAVAKNNTTILGGEISFISEENDGSTFYIKLPCLNANGHIAEPDPNVLEPPINQTFKILVAEDEEINFMLVKSILNQFKPYTFIVIRAKNGKEAVNIFKENVQIDLILMDIKMPIMDGYEATTIMKRLRPNIPVIAHTAYSSDKDLNAAHMAGCDSVICKPINLMHFKQTIIDHITKF